MECLGMVVIVPPTTAFHVAALATMATIVHRLLIDPSPERPLPCPLAFTVASFHLAFFALALLALSFLVFATFVQPNSHPNDADPFTLCLM